MDELREAFEEAWDEHEPEEIKTEDDLPIESDEAKIAEPEGEGDAEPKSIEGADKDDDKAPDAEPESEKSTSDKAPASWQAKAREDWAKVPAAAKQQIEKREKEINTAMQNSATARRAAEQLNAVIAPHKEGMMAQGFNDPFQAISGLLQTESSLRVGSPIQKAQQVAQIIQQYGIDIGTLDSLLVGKAPAENPNSQFEQLLDQRMAPVNDLLTRLNNQQQQETQQVQQGARQSVDEFGGQAEFLNDVRLDMADLLDMSAKRGQQMTLQQAYDKACAIHPEVSNVMRERATQADLMGTQDKTNLKRAAAVSLTGTRAGVGGGGKDLDLRAQIAANWDDLESGG